jgi:7-carboxy-7-deazaguanine synthase
MFQISEIFESIQGESSFSGLPCLFVRFSGCNLDCTWCDTPYAKTKTGLQMDLSVLLSKIKKSGMPYVCLTGGEPLLQPGIDQLLKCLVKENFLVSMETNGSIDWTHIPDEVHCCVDIKCPSSLMQNSFRFDCLDRLRKYDQIKFVIGHLEDYHYAKSIYTKHLKNFNGPIFVSPIKQMLDPSRLANWVLSDKIPFRIHLQIHTILNIR